MRGVGVKAVKKPSRKPSISLSSTSFWNFRASFLDEIRIDPGYLPQGKHKIEQNLFER